MEAKRGILRGFDSGSYRASVEILGSLSTYLEGVPVARHIDAAEMVNGRRVAIILFDPSNPNDAVLLAVWT